MFFDTLPETGPLVLQWHFSQGSCDIQCLQYRQYNLIIDHKYRFEIEEVEIIWLICFLFVDFNDLLNIHDIVDALPDELMGSSDQNGMMDSNHSMQDPSKHHAQLTQLLSGVSSASSMVPPSSKSPMPNLGSLGNLNNAAKSPRSANLSSPPLGMGGKMSQHVGMDNYPSNSAGFSSMNSVGPMVSNANMMNKNIAHNPINSMGVQMSISNMGQQTSSMMSNGPLYSASGHNQGRGNVSGMQQLSSMSQPGVMGGMNHQQMHNPNNMVGHPGMGMQQQQMMKVQYLWLTWFQEFNCYVYNFHKD